MGDKMETRVRGHYITRRGKRIYIRPHMMHINARVHRRHIRRLKREIVELERFEHRYR